MSFNDFIEVLRFPFASRALAAGLLISLCGAVLGVILVLKNYSMIGHALGDVGFTAMSLALALNLNPLAVSMPVVITASFILMFVSYKKGVAGDAAIGMTATGALSAGVIITSLSSGFNIDTSSYMFGSVLSMSDADLILGVILSIVVFSVFAVFYNRLFLVTCDESFARSLGINVTFYQFLISFLTAVTVVIGMRMVGTLLISSFIIFPAMTARRLASGFKGVIITAVCLSAVCFLIGMTASFVWNLPTGAAIVAVNVVCYAAASAFTAVRGGVRLG